MSKLTWIVKGILILLLVISIFVNAILGILLEKTKIQNEHGLINYAKIEKELRNEKGIEARYDKMNNLVKNGQFQDLAAYIYKINPAGKSKDFKGNRNFPVFLDDVPVKIYDREDSMKLQLKYLEIIEKLYNQIISRCNYIRE